MADLLVDRGVWVSIAVALAVTTLAAMVTTVTRRPVVPAAAVHLPAIATAALVAAVAFDRYLPGRTPGRGQDAGIRPWMIAVAGAAVMAVIAALGTRIVGPRRVGAGQHDVLLSGAVALVAVGVFACVPETALLRLVPGPLAVAAVGVAVGRLLPPTRVEVVAVLAALAWIAVVDGWTRGSAVIGAAACIAAVALIPLSTAWSGHTPGASAPGETGAGDAVADEPDGDAPGRAAAAIPWRELTVLMVTVGICSRVAGVLEESRWSTATAAVISALALAGGAAALWWLPGRPGPGRQPLRTTRGHRGAGRGRR